ncbi:MAG: hypothetical protein H6741_20135 [Alphaproteobacteria bacterium]|nr:hypothetical protein [Alphaproteobacteria bacterium]
MPLALAQLLVTASLVYVGLGLAFALPFAARGLAAVDPVAEGSSWRFRLLITPGVVALWPLLALRWARGQQAPTERNAHRDAAS